MRRLAMTIAVETAVDARKTGPTPRRRRGSGRISITATALPAVALALGLLAQPLTTPADTPTRRITGCPYTMLYSAKRQLLKCQ